MWSRQGMIKALQSQCRGRPSGRGDEMCTETWWLYNSARFCKQLAQL